MNYICPNHRFSFKSGLSGSLNTALVGERSHSGWLFRWADQCNRKRKGTLYPFIAVSPYFSPPHLHQCSFLSDKLLARVVSRNAAYSWAFMTAACSCVCPILVSTISWVFWGDFSEFCTNVHFLVVEGHCDVTLMSRNNTLCPQDQRSVSTVSS